ncbi:MAG: adenosine kinase [Bacteroidales bacterium]|nr:adenosine kinase [Bacteroidales bacterium]MDD3431391.1 adenosine kinase [Bacteroidales bacterium]MDD4361619.1 adenosine kinase [Bacteroidales bacterium]MDD4430826.1 adenosine kinase [Bacteroidales bacterium]
MKNLLALGNALVDVLIRLDSEEILTELGIAKGSMQLIDKERFDLIQQSLRSYKKQYASGGSAANTIIGAATLGLPAAFIGKIADDSNGAYFEKDMKQAGVETRLLKGQSSSGTAFTFVSPDGERSFATYLGAAAELRAEDLLPEMFEGYTNIYIEGYLLQNYDLINRILELAKAAEMNIIWDLASYNIVEEHKTFLTETVLPQIDYLFSNELEAEALTGAKADEALDLLATKTKIAVVKTGAKGAMAKRGKETARVPALKVNALDTTGAGDLFAAGFLYGLSMGLPLNDATSIGNITAGNVVEVLGAKMDQARWAVIKNQIRSLL